MSKLKVGQKVTLHGEVRKLSGNEDEWITVHIEGYGAANITLRESHVHAAEAAPKAPAKKRGMEGVLSKH